MTTKRKKKPARELTTDEIADRIFPKPVKKALQHAAQPRAGKSKR